MNLGLVLAIGESFKDFKQKGQDSLLVTQNIKSYSNYFNKVNIFSYKNEKYPLYSNNQLISNAHNIQRYIYALIMPILNIKQFKQCDVIRGLQITGGIPCIVAKILFKKPFVVNYGYDYEQFARLEGKQIQALFYKIVIYFVVKFADAVIITSSHLKQRIIEYAPKKIELIPNSVDINIFKPSIKKRNNIKTILFVGRLEKQKNLFNLIEAISLLKYEKSLIFIGEGSQKVKLEKYAYDKKVKLRILEPVPHNKLAIFYRSADIFVLPSLIEGHPKVLLEAMSSGLSCVGADIQGIREIIGNKKTGVLTGTSSEEISKSIEYLIKNPMIARQLGEKARHHIKKCYDSTKILDLEIKLLKNVARNYQ